MKKRDWVTPAQKKYLVAIAVVVFVVGYPLLLPHLGGDAHQDVPAVLDSLTQGRHTGTASTYYATPSSQTQVFEFDPNEADSTQLLRLGLAPFQVRSIYRYRAKGGRYSTPDDFRRVYRLTNEQWQRLSPWIRIGERYRLVEIKDQGDPRFRRFHRESEQLGDTATHNSSMAAADSIALALDSTPNPAGGGEGARPVYPVKFQGDETVDINQADSALLCRVPGIGQYFARKVVQYRRRLGGYMHVEQLLEIENFPADALAWLEVKDTVPQVRLRVNHLSTRKLTKHPYMGYSRAEENTCYRRIKGSVPGHEAHSKKKHFSPEDIQRLAPYLDFE